MHSSLSSFESWPSWREIVARYWGYVTMLDDLVGRMLPLFTDERYEHLQIDDGLKVRVFSADKRDFMDLDEVSSGTQRQIMLAVLYGMEDEVVGPDSKVWQCSNCFTCFDRCPQDVKPIEVIIALKNLMTQRGLAPDGVVEAAERILKPGGWIHVLITEDRYDAAYIDEWAVGFDELAAHVAELKKSAKIEILLPE